MSAIPVSPIGGRIYFVPGASEICVIFPVLTLVGYCYVASSVRGGGHISWPG